MHQVAFGLIAMLAGAAEPPGKVVEEFWEAAHLDGIPIGSLHTTVRAIDSDAGKQFITSAELELTIRRGTARLRLRFAQGSVETAEGRVIGVSMLQDHGQGRQIVLAGKLEEDRMHVTIDAGRIDRRLRWSDDVAGLRRRQHLFEERRPKSGDHFELATYDPEVNAIVNLRVAVKDREEVTVAGGRKKLLRVEMVPAKLEGPGFNVQRPTQTIWLDENFVPLRRQIELDGLGKVILTRTTKELATAPPGETPARLVDINARNLIALNRTIRKPLAAGTAAYRITLRDDPDPGSAFVSDGHQEVSNVHGQAFDLIVHPIRSTSPRTAPAAPGAEFLGASHYIDADAPIIKEMARRAAGDEKDAWKKAQRIEKWVKAAMRIDNAAPFAPASQVARDLRGDCRLYALLTTALARAEGIPARTALGLVYVEKGGKPNLGFHMWSEVWIDGKWLGLDACMGPGVGIGHIKVADHSWHDTPSQTPLLPIARVLGKVTVEVVKVDVWE